MPRKHAPSHAHIMALLAVVLFSQACESEVGSPDEVFEEGEIVVDASSPINFAYLNLADGGSLVTPSDPSTSTEWHMAFRRFNVRLNGGVAGPGAVSGFNTGNNADLSAEEITALGAADGEAAFAAVTDADIPGASSFTEDMLVPDEGATWFRFDPQAGTIVANPGAAWKVRESSGRGHAVFRVVDLRMDGMRPLGLSIEYRRQDPGGTLGPADTAVINFTGGPVFLGLSEGEQHQTGDGCGWDLGASPELVVSVNGSCQAGTFPLDPTDSFTALERADDAPGYAGFLSVIAGAFPVTADDASGIFWYDIRENSRMWPTYNVFLVRAGEEVYKVQIFDYYGATGQSGFPSVRFQRLQ